MRSKWPCIASAVSPAVGLAMAVALAGGNAARAAEPGYVVESYDPSKAYNGTTLFADHNPTNLRVVQVNMQGDKVWEYMIPTNWAENMGAGFDAELLTNGNILIVLSGHGLIEINRSGDIAWSNMDAQVSHDADRLPNGNTIYIYGDNDAATSAVVKEVLPSGELVWAWYATNEYTVWPYFPYTNVYRGGWTHCNAATRMDDGNTLINLRNFDLTILVDTNGHTVWSYDWTNLYAGEFPIGYDPHDPELVTTNRMLVCLQWESPYQVAELDRFGGTSIWAYARAGLRTTRDADRLPNGNTLIVGVMTQMENSVMFEVTPESNIVWQLRMTNRSTAGSPGWFFKAQRISDFEQDGFADQTDLDDDNDGMTDEEEAVAGTSPTNANDYFRIENIRESDITNAVLINWNSVTGRIYRVFTNYNLSVSWPTSHAYEAVGSGYSLSYTNGQQDAYPRFFRLGVNLE